MLSLLAGIHSIFILFSYYNDCPVTNAAKCNIRGKKEVKKVLKSDHIADTVSSTITETVVRPSDRVGL